MDYYPENYLLEITALLNEPRPPLDSGKDPARFGLVWSAIRQIWWLEWFLQAGPEAFREKFNSQPLEDQQALAAPVCRWFLYRPRLQRLYPERSGFQTAVRWDLTRGGSLVILSGAEAEKAPLGVYFVFPHSQIWPDLLHLLDWKAFLNPAEINYLERDLEVASLSRLAGVRERTERLRSLLARPAPPEKMGKTSEREIPPATAPIRPVHKRQKKKKSAGQLRLFE